MPLPTTLAAVLFVELADFSDLLSTDERAALELLASYRQAVAPIVDEHRGETVDVTGSELLVVFSSAVAAVQCGLHLCKALQSFSASSGGAGRAGARVGVHLGEIWRDSGKVYGNGVNVAARVMQAAPPGALFVSEDVYRQVSGKLDLAAREVVDAVLKNIDRPLVLHELDTGRGFLALGATASKHGDAVHAPPHPVLHSGPHAVGHAEARAVAHPDPLQRLVYASNFLPGPAVHELASRLEAELSETIRASVAREVNQALAEVQSMRANLSHDNLKAVFDDSKPRAATHTERHGHAVSESAIDDQEVRREKLSDRIAAATKALVMSGGIAAGLGYGYVATGKWPLALGAALVVLAPFMSNLKRLIVASSELRLVDRRARRKAGKG